MSLPYYVAAPDTHPDWKAKADTVIPDDPAGVGDVLQWCAMKANELGTGLGLLGGTFDLGTHGVLFTKGGVDGADPLDFFVKGTTLNRCTVRYRGNGAAFGWGDTRNNVHGRQAIVEDVTVNMQGSTGLARAIDLKRASNGSRMVGVEIEGAAGPPFHLYRCYGFYAPSWLAKACGQPALIDNCNGSTFGPAFRVTSMKSAGVRLFFNDANDPWYLFDEDGGANAMTTVFGGTVEVCDGPAIDIDRGDEVEVRNVYVEGCFSPDGPANEGQITVRGSDDGYSRGVTIRKNRINGDRGGDLGKAPRGVFLSRSENAVVDENDTSNHTHEGVYNAASAARTVFRVPIKTNNEPRAITDNSTTTRYR